MREAEQLRNALLTIERLQAEVERLSIDSLTGVAGRAVFERELLASFAQMKRTERPVGILMLDIDHFKDVNDTFGHPAGDDVLKDVAKAASSHMRGSDTFARYGGEEFVAIVRDASPPALTKLAERIRLSVAELTFKDVNRKITVSIGATLMDRLDQEPQDAIKRADVALYVAKDEGRDRVWFATALD